jgi:hypothetical protein
MADVSNPQPGTGNGRNAERMVAAVDALRAATSDLARALAESADARCASRVPDTA